VEAITIRSEEWLYHTSCWQPPRCHWFSRARELVCGRRNTRIYESASRCLAVLLIVGYSRQIVYIHSWFIQVDVGLDPWTDARLGQSEDGIHPTGASLAISGKSICLRPRLSSSFIAWSLAPKDPTGVCMHLRLGQWPYTRVSVSPFGSMYNAMIYCFCTALSETFTSMSQSFVIDLSVGWPCCDSTI
jgi:hypothetical protein